MRKSYSFHLPDFKSVVLFCSATVALVRGKNPSLAYNYKMHGGVVVFLSRHTPSLLVPARTCMLSAFLSILRSWGEGNLGSFACALSQYSTVTQHHRKQHFLAVENKSNCQPPCGGIRMCWKPASPFCVACRWEVFLLLLASVWRNPDDVLVWVGGDGKGEDAAWFWIEE